MLGTTIAHYKITAKLGQGGMGEVYRATDTKLDREVAIKVLPESFAVDKERLARFEREAKTLATLNHPNIAGIFGLEESANSQALVLELVDGDDLSDVLKRGPLPIEEVLDICKQIAEALEAAHDKGIIHRDLKPSNIKITSDGQVKVLDFGLAKSAPAIDNDFDADSPTITADYTLPGTLLGTAGYMSPEQARGKTVDKRSDIWSFGVVLFECLTGKRMFTGETVTDSIGALLHREIEWDQLPTNTPPAIELLLRKCLERDRKRRLPDIGAARLDLELAVTNPSRSWIGLPAEDTANGSGKQARGLSVWHAMLTGCAVLSTAFAAWLLKPSKEWERPPHRHLEIYLGEGKELYTRHNNVLRISPDGTKVAYIAKSSENDSPDGIYLRKLNQLKPEFLEGTTGAIQLVFSPDSDEIAFQVGTSIKKISLESGAIVPLMDAPYSEVLEWTRESGILLSGDWRNPSILKGAVGKSEFEPLTAIVEDERAHTSPQILPDGRGVLYSAATGFRFDRGETSLRIQRVPGETKIVVEDAVGGKYLPTGHLIFLRDSMIWAVPFDLDRLKVSGKERILFPAVGGRAAGGGFDISDEGALVHLPGKMIPPPSYDLFWVDRAGKRKEVGLPSGEYFSFKLSPDGRKVAYIGFDKMNLNMWVYAFESSSPIRLTNHDGEDASPVWSPTGESIVFSSNRDESGKRSIYCKRVDDFEEAKLLLTSSDNLSPKSWNPVEDVLVYTDQNGGDENLMMVSLEGSDEAGWTAGEPRKFQATPNLERNGSFSWNGQWLAYQLHEDQENSVPEVYVIQFPRKSKGRGIRVSNIGGRSNFPVWSRDGSELFFGNYGTRGQRRSQVYIANYAIEEGELVFNPSVTPWEGAEFQQMRASRSFDVHPGGQRVLVREYSEEYQAALQKTDHFGFFENFFDYLKEKVPIDPK